MAEINLLQSSNRQSSERSAQKTWSTVGVALLTLTVLSYAALFILTKQTTAKVQDVLSEQASTQASIQNQDLYSTLVSNQQKVKNLSVLLDNHLNWCRILPDFAQNTIKTAKYTKLTANSDGSTTITGTVPDFQELAKLIQAFQQSQKQFVKEVKLVNIGLGSQEVNNITYTLNVTFNAKVLGDYSNQCSS